SPPHREAVAPGCRVCAWVIHADVVLHGVHVSTRKPFGKLQFFRVGGSGAIHPELLVKADSFYDEGVTFPTPYGVTIVAGHEVSWVLTPVGIDDAICVRSTDVEDVNAFQFTIFDDFSSVGCYKLACIAGRLATGVRFHF